jgi:hypothetical protein
MNPSAASVKISGRRGPGEIAHHANIGAIKFDEDVVENHAGSMQPTDSDAFEALRCCVRLNHDETKIPPERFVI